MGALLSCIASGIGFCFCSACCSLLGACCGNDKPSHIPPSVTSGRKRSVFLMVIALGLALGFQYGVAPWLVDNDDYTGPLSDNWLDGCEDYETAEFRESCAGNSGVYRVSFAAVVFFVLAAIIVLIKPSFNREVWPAKYAMFFFVCAATIVIPNEPLFADIFLNIARVGGVAFICLQQIIIIDVAYSWNDSWVEKGDAAEADDIGSGRKWFGALIASAVGMFLCAIGCIALLFINFTGCATNDAFIIVTLVMMVLITAAQLSGEEGNLLSSAAVSLWAVFLCYAAVARNPNGSCNPQFGEQDRLSVILSIIVMGISMTWTGWSYTAEDRLTGGSKPEPLVPENSNNSNGRKVSGVVTGYGTNNDEEERSNPLHGDDEEEANNNPNLLSNSWKLNIMLASITCWMAMALTSWGEIQGNGSAANATVGRVGMWIIISSQWFVLSLYLWTLVAPRLFPDRDFS